MKKVLVLATVFSVLFAVAWIVLLQGRYSWHQKLTITVDTPAGEVSSSAVSAVSWRKQWIR